MNVRARSSMGARSLARLDRAGTGNYEFRSGGIPSSPPV